MSEREEEYLDLPVALSGCPNLETVLKDTYIEQELLEGANQYYCETCRKLVDAKRVSIHVCMNPQHTPKILSTIILMIYLHLEESYNT